MEINRCTCCGSLICAIIVVLFALLLLFFVVWFFFGFRTLCLMTNLYFFCGAQSFWGFPSTGEFWVFFQVTRKRWPVFATDLLLKIDVTSYCEKTPTHKGASMGFLLIFRKSSPQNESSSKSSDTFNTRFFPKRCYTFSFNHRAQSADTFRSELFHASWRSPKCLIVGLGARGMRFDSETPPKFTFSWRVDRSIRNNFVVFDHFAWRTYLPWSSKAASMVLLSKKWFNLPIISSLFSVISHLFPISTILAEYSIACRMIRPV